MTAYSRAYKQTAHQQKARRRENENRRKSNKRKRKRTENNVQRVYGICVAGNPLGNDQFHNAICTLMAWPSRKSILKLRMLPRRYLDEMGHTSQSSWKGNILKLLQEAKSLPTIYRKSETMFTPSFTLKSTLCGLRALLKVTPTATQAANGLTIVKMKMRYQGKLY